MYGNFSSGDRLPLVRYNPCCHFIHHVANNTRRWHRVSSRSLTAQILDGAIQNSPHSGHRAKENSIQLLSGDSEADPAESNLPLGVFPAFMEAFRILEKLFPVLRVGYLFMLMVLGNVNKMFVCFSMVLLLLLLFVVCVFLLFIVCCVFAVVCCFCVFGWFVFGGRIFSLVYSLLVVLICHSREFWTDQANNRIHTQICHQTSALLPV